jgi:signal transduction histidine kinase
MMRKSGRIDPTPARSNLRAQVLQVMLGPWPIRPLLTGIVVAMVFQYGSADINSATALDAPEVISGLPLSIARGFAVALPLWALVTLRRWITGNRPLTRLSYLAIIAIGGTCAGSLRFWLSDGSVMDDPRLYLVFVLRATFLLLITHIVFGLADVRLRSQIRRADRALADVERQQRIVLESEERAKTQVSQFLHTTVQAGLVTVGMQLRQLENDVPEAAAQRVSSIREAIETIRSEDVRQASHALNPDIPTVGLRRALKGLGDRYAPSMAVSVSVNRSDDWPQGVSSDHLLACYRIVEQGLLNSAVHGSASSADVRVTVSPGEIEITVTDDGSGLRSESPEPGAGLVLIKAWTTRFYGTWSLEPGVPKGTRLHARLHYDDLSGEQELGGNADVRMERSLDGALVTDLKRTSVRQSPHPGSST